MNTLSISQHINSFLVILIFGSLVLLSFLLIVNPWRVNKKANVLFGIFLFLWSTFWIEEVFAMSGMNSMASSTEFVLRYLQFLTPIFFYYGVVFYTNPDFKSGKSDIKYLVLPFVYLIGLIANRIFELEGLIPSILNVLIIFQALYFTILSYFRIKEHKKKINLFTANTEEIDLAWLESIIIALIVLSIFIGVYNLIFTTIHLNLFANIFSTLIVFFVAIHTVNQKEIFLLDENERNKIIDANQNSSSEKRKLISTDELVEMKVKLTMIMEKEQPYLDTELSLLQLSKIMDITPHQLSYLINEGFNENFFMYVNKYRVEKVKEYLHDDKKKNLAILGIGFESGFNSKTSFYTTFKKITSMTPTEYLKMSSKL